MRYFLSCDDSAHWFLVELEHADEWYEWTDQLSKDAADWNTPKFATRIDGGPGGVSFIDPKPR